MGEKIITKRGKKENTKEESYLSPVPAGHYPSAKLRVFKSRRDHRAKNS